MLLLARDNIDPEGRGNYGQTALGLSSARGHEGVVRQLLVRDDIDPNKPGKYGETPLWWASSNGMGEWSGYYSHGVMFIPTCQPAILQHHSWRLLWVGMSVVMGCRS